ncbi:MAG: hypothetical protein ACT4QG_10665 [Sporichthyaceae bacterium]
MASRVRTVGSAIALAVLLGTAGCGGGDEKSVAANETAPSPSASATASAAPADASASTDDVAAIKKVASQIAKASTEAQMASVCKNLFTSRFVDEVFGTQAKCRDGAEEDPSTAKVADVVVSGETATAKVTLKDSATEAEATGEWTFVREATKWRLDA